jgi:hypothetical protein
MTYTATPYGTRPNPVAVLPTGHSVSPRELTTSTFWNPDWVAYVLFKQNDARTRPTRVLTSHGALGWKIGDVKHLAHDQTGAYLGEYKVVGIAYADTSKGAPMTGDVPTIRIKHCVAK